MDVDFQSSQVNCRNQEVSSGGRNVIIDSMSNDLVKMQSKGDATGDSEKLRQMQDL